MKSELIIRAEIKEELIECLRIPNRADDPKILNIQATKILTSIGLGKLKYFKIEYPA